MIKSVLEKPLLLYQVYSWNLKKAHFKKNREISSNIIRIETEKKIQKNRQNIAVTIPILFGQYITMKHITKHT